METQTEGKVHGLGKEKKGTSHSYPKHTTITTDNHHHGMTTTQGRRSPSASAVVSSLGIGPSPDDHKHNKHVPTPSNNLNSKRIPNYLRPTKSSNLDFSSSSSSPIHGKKQALASNSNINNTMATQNQKSTPNLNRRRSFDKPPSANSNINNTTATQTTQKPTPNLNRRRSFDKPPSTNFFLQKSLTFVNPTITTIERNLRSSSLSHTSLPRTSYLPKSHYQHQHQERLLKASSSIHSRDVKKSHSSITINARSPTMTSCSSNSVKKSTIAYTCINKKQNNATTGSVVVDASTKALIAAASSSSTSGFPEINDDPPLLLAECQQEDQEYSLVTDDVEEDLVKVESMHIELPHDIIPILQENHNNDEHVVDVSIVQLAEPMKNQHEDANNNLKPYEPKETVSSEDQNANASSLDVKMVEEEIEETSSRCLNNTHQKLGGEDHEKDESHLGLKVEESLATNLKEEETSAKVKSSEEKENEEQQQQQQVDEVGSKIVKSEERDHQVKEGHDVGLVVAGGADTEETKSEEAKAKPLWQMGQVQKQGKMASHSDSQTYNDVIEETASKLRDKRKNKVNALVGAFETVISLQDQP